MGLPTLKTKERLTFGKSNTKKIRYEKKTPAVIYGLNKKNRHVTFDPRDIERLFRNEKNGRNTQIELDIETEKGTEKETVLAYQIQKNAITQFIEHIDFIRTSDKVKVRAVVPVELIGNAPGLKMGGVLIHKLRDIVVKCLPQDIPATIKVDMTQLKVNEFFKVKDLKLGDIEIISNNDDTIVRIAAPRTLIEESEESTETEEGEDGDVSESDSDTTKSVDSDNSSSEN